MFESSNKKISRAFKHKVWANCFGSHNQGRCWICPRTIIKSGFTCGFISPRAHGGAIELNNIRPLCNQCGMNIGTRNMFDIMCEIGSAPPFADWDFEVWRERWYHQHTARASGEEPMDLELRPKPTM